ncbi:phosphatidylinositol transfer protein alpha isoform-like [Lytechinus variegatus]|uniref:phosphatidylinositol transfer protein alpha isoform-like n=1 Tax=Lytechinus variegatus TaxID=7654 RepID=UPI001BB222CB|nr:phosphatidylinositol transfer protein alpha isoform-like [Lytechinus variegatus]
MEGAPGPVYRIYRIVLPYLSSEKAHIGLLYNLCKSSCEETGGGEGVEMIANNIADSTRFPKRVKPGEQVYYYHKILHLASKVPAFIRLLAPKGSLEVHQKTWDTFPVIRSEYSNPDYMKDGFIFIRHTIFQDNDKASMADSVFDNISVIGEDKIKQAAIVDIDIVNDPVSSADYSEETDPTKVRLEKINCGPLTSDWKEKETKFMTLYLFEEIEFKWWGLQTKVQSVMIKANHRIHRNFYRKMFCNLDEWYDMTIEQIRELEDKTKEELQKMLRSGDVRGMVEK